MILRDYQQEVLRYYEKNLEDFLVHLPTGAGKTAIMVALIKKAYERGETVLALVHGRSLVSQLSLALEKANTTHNTVMGGGEISSFVTVASVDTLRSRYLENYKPKLIVVDEAHCAVAPSYKEIFKKLIGARKALFTATPYRPGLNYLVKEENVLRPILYLDLVRRGFLVEAEYYSVEMSDVVDKIEVSSSGEYKQDEAFNAFDKSYIYSTVEENYSRFGDGPSLVFAINKKHSLNIRDSLLRLGVKAVHVEDTTSLEERSSLLTKLKNGDIDCICNVGIFTTGVDIPCLKNIFLIRPTKSLILYAQMLGRGSRPYEGKNFFRVIDMGGNYHRHGPIEWLPKAKLEKKKGRSSNVEILKKCENCTVKFNLFAFGRKCPSCKHVHPINEPERVDTELVKVDRLQKFLKKHVEILFYAGYQVEWLWHRLKDNFGFDVAGTFVPVDVSLESLFFRFFPEKANKEAIEEYLKRKQLKEKQKPNHYFKEKRIYIK